MMKRIYIAVTILMTTNAFSPNGFSMGFASRSMVDHPVSHPVEGRSTYAWRSKVGAWGENLVDGNLKRRKFNEIHEIKNGSNNGIDRIAIRRSRSGQIIDVKLVEVKVSQARTPSLKDTKFGKQSSRTWLAHNLKEIRKSADPDVRYLALEISRFRKSSGKSIESLAEVSQINLKSGKITTFGFDGKTVKSSYSVERLLNQMQRRGNKQIREWATRSLAQFDQLRSTSMESWLSVGTAGRSKAAVLINAKSGSPIVKNVLRSSRNSGSRISPAMLSRSVGKVAVIATLLIDSKEVWDTESAYRRGHISYRQRNIQHISSVGGMGGAFFAVIGGSYTGGVLGTLGGPIAWITVPAGGFIGGIIGGVGGYLIGSKTAIYGATAWYESLDASVREKFEIDMLSMKGGDIR